jgi:hypothetical protein
MPFIHRRTVGEALKAAAGFFGAGVALGAGGTSSPAPEDAANDRIRETRNKRENTTLLV